MSDAIHTADGLSLHTRLWDADAPRGQVLLVHGLGEHAGRYEELAQTLCSHGWRVAAYDQRGHGQSEGPRGLIAADDSLLADLGRMLSVVRAAGSGPLVLLGHSMGGAVAARYVAEGLAERPAAWWQPVEALVLSSPALDIGASALQRLLLAVVPRLLPSLCVGNGLDAAWISRDPAVVAGYLADPLVHDRISGRLGRFLAQAGPAVQAVAPRWSVPTLLMWAGADRCVAPAGSARFAQQAPSAVLSHRAWPGLAHEIFHEPERAEVMAALLDWLDTRYPAGI
ncbi:alpha/beta hydrolase [Ideonella alba]|uniref:Lysophospholipase n=1 Tax=Ideonella alba TaxID=2824118 RepID=A0A940YCN8_9BURK|nr:alpha/beta hydrolase [Ideonella alba]MBQ0933133.1 lysophospholipase [Ideonella alba]